MQYKEFIGRVEGALQPISSEGAERATISTLSMLSEILSPEATKNLSSHLPSELAEKLDNRPPENPQEPASGFSLEDFCELVAEQEGVGIVRDEARNHAIGVMKAVREAYGVGTDVGSDHDLGAAETELEELREELPEDFAPLFH